MYYVELSKKYLQESECDHCRIKQNQQTIDNLTHIRKTNQNKPTIRQSDINACSNNIV